MILPKIRDPRLVTVRRGGSLLDADHHLLALWAATCAEHVLPHFEQVRRDDRRPRDAIARARAWVRGEVRMSDSREAAFASNAAARATSGAARYAALAAGQAAAVAHVAAHDLGAAAYAIRAAREAATIGEADAAGVSECRWQREQLPPEILALASMTSGVATTCAGGYSLPDIVRSPGVVAGGERDVVARLGRARWRSLAVGGSSG
jgi:hypothetical protein